MLLRPFLTLACLVPLMACGASDAESVGSLSLQLTDSPGAFERVDVELSSAAIHDATQAPETGWVAIPLKTVTVNLVELRSGRELPLAQSSVPVGNYDRIEVSVIKATVTIGGQAHPLTLEGGKERARVDYAFRVDPLDKTEMLLDFDAGASVRFDGDGSLRLDPHITVRSERRQ